MLLSSGTFEDDVTIDPGFFKTKMTGNGVDNRKVTAPFAPCCFISRDRGNPLSWNFSFDVLPNKQFLGGNIGTPLARTDCVKSFDIDGTTIGTYQDLNTNGSGYFNYQLKRSPLVGIDVIQWAGNKSYSNTSVRTISHTLGVVPDIVVAWAATLLRFGEVIFVNYSPVIWFREIGTVGYPAYGAVPWGNLQFYYGGDNVYADSQQQCFDDGIMSSGSISVRNGSFDTPSRPTIDLNLENVQHAALLAASVEGVQSIQCYTGTGASKKVTLDFQPDTILFFRFDNQSKNIAMNRDSTNPVRDYIPLTDDTPATNGSDMLSWDADGFTLTSSMAWNASGAKCAFWAWKSGY